MGRELLPTGTSGSGSTLRHRGGARAVPAAAQAAWIRWPGRPAGPTGPGAVRGRAFPRWQRPRAACPGGSGSGGRHPSGGHGDALGASASRAWWRGLPARLSTTPGQPHSLMEPVVAESPAPAPARSRRRDASTCQRHRQPTTGRASPELPHCWGRGHSRRAHHPHQGEVGPRLPCQWSGAAPAGPHSRGSKGVAAGAATPPG